MLAADYVVNISDEFSGNPSVSWVIQTPVGDKTVHVPVMLLSKFHEFTIS